MLPAREWLALVRAAAQIAFRQLQAELESHFGGRCRAGSTATVALVVPCVAPFRSSARSGGGDNAQSGGACFRGDARGDAVGADVGDGDADGGNGIGDDVSTGGRTCDDGGCGWRVVVAWVGDSRAALFGPGGASASATEDHRLDLPRERRRAQGVQHALAAAAAEAAALAAGAAEAAAASETTVKSPRPSLLLPTSLSWFSSKKLSRSSLSSSSSSSSKSNP
jgi:serine/threonine protein phosphatase PrpC